MSGEIEVPETPNWLKDLEEKREKRLKARLGHEAGAGAPCLKCEDKCPGLDLHFWRKACKICRCPKEEHDVHDDDIYGWAQFQLLGSKPNKIKTKIVLPGKKDEVELEWAPKGQKDTIDKYLKTLPPEKIPIKGSQAAQERKQMLQKQIPIHDIDPALCHELNEDEVSKMEEYIAHVKNSSVGVGQIVNLSNVIKANLHNISPQEAHIIASRYAKDIPYSELVKFQAGLAKNLEKLTVNDQKNKKPNLPHMRPNELIKNNESLVNPSISNKFKDINYKGYANSDTNALPNAQYATGFKSGNPVGQFENTDYKNPTSNKFNDINYKGYPNNEPNMQYPAGSFENNESVATNPVFNKFKDINYKGYANSDANTSPNAQYATGFKSGNAIDQFENSDCKNPISNKFKDINYKGYPTNEPNSFPNFPHATNFENNEYVANPSVGNKFKDINYKGYTNNDTNVFPNAQYATGLKSGNPGSKPDYDINEKLLQGTNFDPAKTPSQFSGYKTGGYKPYTPTRSGVGLIGENTPDKTSNAHRPEESGINSAKYAKNLQEKFGAPLNRNPSPLPSYGASKYDIHSDNQNPKAPRSVKDLIYSTYDPSQGPVPEEDSNKPKFSLNPEEKPFTDGNKQNAGLERPFSDGNHHMVKKPLTQQHPSNLTVPEDYLEPSNVNIGAIRDVTYPYPEIREAVTAENNFEEEFDDDYSPDSIREILNNIKLPECHYCKKPFEENEFAVMIERAKFMFHAGCFKCAGCNQNLADNIYFYHKETNNIYCGRDYAKIKGYPRCNACDELIFTKEYCLAENSTFHLKHFCCFQCDTPLAGREYTLEDDKPYCLPCFESSKASKCSTCMNVIKPDELGCNLNGVHFHATEKCVACIVCSKPLMGKKLLLRNDKLYCSHDCFNSVK